MFVKDSLFGKTSIPVVAKSLDASMLRSKAIADNLANVNTPGYKRVEVKFEEQLREALDNRKIKGRRDHPRHMPLGALDIDQVQPVAYRPEDPTLPGGVNNVDVDVEAAKLAENQILFDFGVKFISERKGAIEAAIAGRSQG